MTGQVIALEGANSDSTRLWHMRLGHTDKKSFQALAKQGLLKGAKTCKLELCEQCVVGKKMKVKFDITIHCTEGILDYDHTHFGTYQDYVTWR